MSSDIFRRRCAPQLAAPDCATFLAQGRHCCSAKAAQAGSSAHLPCEASAAAQHMHGAECHAAAAVRALALLKLLLHFAPPSAWSLLPALPLTISQQRMQCSAHAGAGVPIGTLTIACSCAPGADLHLLRT